MTTIGLVCYPDCTLDDFHYIQEEKTCYLRIAENHQIFFLTPINHSQPFRVSRSSYAPEIIAGWLKSRDCDAYRTFHEAVPGKYYCRMELTHGLSLVHFSPADACSLFYYAKGNEYCQRRIDRLFAIFVAMKEYLLPELVETLLNWNLEVQLLTFQESPLLFSKRKYEVSRNRVTEGILLTPQMQRDLGL
jgi:hypothetical protein